MILFLAIAMFFFGFMTISLTVDCDLDIVGAIIGSIECTIALMVIVFKAIGAI